MKTPQLNSTNPLPPKYDRQYRYPLDTMEVGESFQVPGDRKNSVSSVASRRGKLLNRKFSVRVVDGVLTCWRIS